MENVARVLLIAGGAILLAMSSGHAFITFGELRRPGALSPADPVVRVVMDSSSVRIDPQLNMWRAWIGFNFSHSLGAMIASGAIVAIGVFDFAMFADCVALRVAAPVVLAAYLAIAAGFWFSLVRAGLTASLVCITLAAVLA